MPDFLVLETARLILRVPREEDIDGWAELMGDEDAARFIGGAQPRSAAWRTMAAMTGSWVLKGFSMFSVIEKTSGDWIGRIGPWEPEGWPAAEVGWSLKRSAWGRGYATEAAAASIDWAFDHLGWTDVAHMIDLANAPSAAVASRLGSRHIRDVRLPEPFPFAVQMWGQSRAQWKARARP